MTKNIDELLEETKRLSKENKELKQKLLEAEESINAIKKGNIDALIVADKEDLKVYTEKTADKTYRILIEKMHEGAVTLNEDGTILYCNSYFANMVNLPLQKVIGTKFENFIEDSSKERFGALLKQGVKNPAKEEVYINNNDGAAIPVLMSVNSLSLDNNFALSIILTDLTIKNKNQEELKRRAQQLEQKNLELGSANKQLAIQIKENIKRAEERKKDEEHIGLLASIVESSDDAIISKSLDGTIKSWNRAGEKIFGYTAKEAVGKPITLIIPPEYFNEEKKIIEKIRNNEIVHYETVRRKKNGEQLHVSITVSPLKDLQGNIVGASKIARDISSRKKSEEELIKTNKELIFQIEEKEKRGAELSVANKDVKELDELNTHKETILAILSHDLRSPLNGIIGTAELLKSDFETMKRDEAKQMIDLLYKSSKAELNMLDYLLEWARIKYASEAFSPSKIDLSQYVKKVFETLNENAVANKIHLRNEIEENVSIFADGKMVLSVLQNIVSNAIKHTPSGGKVTVSAKREDDKIIVEVKDTGVGMSKEIQGKLFTPQMDFLSNARKENKGAGIGLLLAKGFLEKNGGEIWVESVEGKGSSFYFTLPVDKVNEITPPPPTGRIRT